MVMPDALVSRCCSVWLSRDHRLWWRVYESEPCTATSGQRRRAVAGRAGVAISFSGSGPTDPQGSGAQLRVELR